MPQLHVETRYTNRSGCSSDRSIKVNAKAKKVTFTKTQIEQTSTKSEKGNDDLHGRNSPSPEVQNQIETVFALDSLLRSRLKLCQI